MNDQVTDLADLERQAVQRGPAFGEDAHIVCDNLVRIYRTEGVEVVALQGLDLLVSRGEMMGIIGASGSGKSTLLNILSGLDVPTAGAVRVAGADLLDMSARDRLRFRRRLVGFIWQQTARNLIPYLTAGENVEMPMRFAGLRRRPRRARAGELLELMGVGHCAGHRSAEMSGGEQQRTAIAVAVANEPQVVLADEPTGELDTASGEQVFDTLRRTNRELGVTTVVVTHDPDVTELLDRTVGIRDGRVGSEVRRRAATNTHGQEEIVAEEYAVLDRAGRLQLPRDFTDTLDMRDRVRLALEPDHIGVWPDADEPDESSSDRS